MRLGSEKNIKNLACCEFILTRLKPFLTALMLLSMIPDAFSQSYSTGYSKYVKGDFAGAENAFKLTLNKSISDAEKARLHKMIGISQYMQGKRIAAETSFQQAKALNPYINISASEVLDDSIIPFFNTVQAAPSKASSRPAPAAASTTLKIYANVPGATITVDGVKLGTIGKPISVTPGIHEVTVSARGYQAVTQPIDIRSGVANNLSVNLKKATSTKPEPAPVILTPPDPVPEPKVTKSDAETKKDKVKKSRKKSKISKSGSKKVVRKRKTRRKKSGSSKSKPSTALYMAPFGTGQYVNQKPLLGATFTVLQGGSLIYGVMQFLASEKLLNETNAEIERQDEERAQITDPTLREQAQKDAETYQADQQAKLDSIYLQQIIGFSVFGISWAASIIEAFMSGPSGSGHASVYERDMPSYLAHTDSEPDIHEQRTVTPDFSLDLAPIPVPVQYLKDRQKPETAISLQLKIDF